MATLLSLKATTIYRYSTIAISKVYRLFASFRTQGDESRRPIILASCMWRSIHCRLAPSNAHSYLTQYVLLVSFSHYFKHCIAKCCQLFKRTHTHTLQIHSPRLLNSKLYKNGLLAYTQPTSIGSPNNC